MKEKLAEYEEKRIELLKKRNITLIIGLSITVILAILYFTLLHVAFIIAAFVSLLVTVIIVVCICSSPKLAQFKTDIVASLVKEELGEDAEYDPKQGVNISTFSIPGFFKKPDRYHTEDFISGTYNNIKFYLADCHLEERHTRTNGKGQTSTYYETYFKGRFIAIDLLRDNLDVILKIVETKWLGLNKKGLEPVETESIEFNEKFDIYTSDKEKTFYILTPSLIQKMLNLEQMYKGTIFFAFMNGMFYIAINDKSDAFDIKLSTPIDDKFYNKILQDIQIAPAIINEFGLDKDKYVINR